METRLARCPWDKGLISAPVLDPLAPHFIRRKDYGCGKRAARWGYPKCVPLTACGRRTGEEARGGAVKMRPGDKEILLQALEHFVLRRLPKKNVRQCRCRSLTHCWKEATSGVKCSGHSDSAPAALGNCVFRKGSEE